MGGVWVVMLTAYNLTHSTLMLIKALINSMKQSGDARFLSYTSHHSYTLIPEKGGKVRHHKINL